MKITMKLKRELLHNAEKQQREAKKSAQCLYGKYAFAVIFNGVGRDEPSCEIGYMTWHNKSPIFTVTGKATTWKEALRLATADATEKAKRMRKIMDRL